MRLSIPESKQSQVYCNLKYWEADVLPTREVRAMLHQTQDQKRLACMEASYDCNIDVLTEY